MLRCFVFFFFVVVAVLREEDYPDKPNEYIESCIGMSEPVAKVCQLLSLLARHELFRNDISYVLFSGVADDVSAVCGQQWTETETARILQERNSASV